MYNNRERTLLYIVNSDVHFLGHLNNFGPTLSLTLLIN